MKYGSTYSQNSSMCRIIFRKLRRLAAAKTSDPCFKQSLRHSLFVVAIGCGGIWAERGTKLKLRLKFINSKWLNLNYNKYIQYNFYKI